MVQQYIDIKYKHYKCCTVQAERKHCIPQFFLFQRIGIFYKKEGYPWFYIIAITDLA